MSGVIETHRRPQRRTKAGRLVSSITREELALYFHLPSEKACKELGVGLTILKRVCRKLGIPRWPYNRVPKAHLDSTPSDCKSDSLSGGSPSQSTPETSAAVTRYASAGRSNPASAPAAGQAPPPHPFFQQQQPQQPPPQQQQQRPFYYPLPPPLPQQQLPSQLPPAVQKQPQALYGAGAHCGARSLHLGYGGGGIGGAPVWESLLGQHPSLVAAVSGQPGPLLDPAEFSRLASHPDAQPLMHEGRQRSADSSRTTWPLGGPDSGLPSLEASPASGSPSLLHPQLSPLLQHLPGDRQQQQLWRQWQGWQHAQRGGGAAAVGYGGGQHAYAVAVAPPAEPARGGAAQQALSQEELTAQVEATLACVQALLRQQQAAMEAEEGGAEGALMGAGAGVVRPTAVSLSQLIQGRGVAPADYMPLPPYQAPDRYPPAEQLQLQAQHYRATRPGSAPLRLTSPPAATFPPAASGSFPPAPAHGSQHAQRSEQEEPAHEHAEALALLAHLAQHATRHGYSTAGKDGRWGAAR